MSETINRYIDVVLNVPLNQAFTYREPADDGKKELPKDPFGYRVEVKFGNRKTTGFVTAVYDSIPKTCSVNTIFCYNRKFCSVTNIDNSNISTIMLNYTASTIIYI